MAGDDKDEPGEIYASSTGGKFYEGHVFKIFRGSRSGVIRSRSGRELPFVFEHMQMVGPVRRFEDLREGMSVEFDVGWTSSGLRVSVLRAG